MTRTRPEPESSTRAISAQLARALASLCVLVLLAAGNVFAYPSYDDGTGVGCVECHNGFVGGTGPLHFQHRTQFDVATCNLCHPNGGGTTPVLTYWSGPGGGYGCAGCHGQDYGETSPNSGEAKATAYGLRQVHVNAGKMECGTGYCHAPGALSHPDPFPPLFPENVAPPYFDALYSNLTNPCDSSQEDLPFDADSVGLDNDGDGAADYPADSDCSPPPTPTPTPVFGCGAAPLSPVTCVPPDKAVLLVNEKNLGKEKLKVVLKKLVPSVTPGDFGDPIGGSTAYKICVYDASDALAGEYTVAQAGNTCGDKPCWSPISTKGYKYRDKGTTADGILKMVLVGGDPGKGKVVIVGKNGGTMPTGVAAALQGQSHATVQLLSSDASCFGATLTNVKKADGVLFKAIGP